MYLPVTGIKPRSSVFLGECVTLLATILWSPFRVGLGGGPDILVWNVFFLQTHSNWIATWLCDVNH